MATVPENLEKILQARYGEEVRMAIHDSIADSYRASTGEKLDSMLSMLNPLSIVKASNGYFNNLLFNMERSVKGQGYIDANGTFQSYTYEGDDYAVITFDNIESLSGSVISIGIPNIPESRIDFSSACFFDSEGSLITSYQYKSFANSNFDDNSEIFISLQVPYSAKTFSFTNRASICGPHETAFFFISPLSNIIESTILNDALASFNASEVEWTKGWYIDSKTGDPAIYGGGNKDYYQISDFIAINGSPKKLIAYVPYTGETTDKSAIVAFYDKNKNFIDSIAANNSKDLFIFKDIPSKHVGSYIKYNVPQNAKYFRVTTVTFVINLKSFRIWFYNHSYSSLNDSSSNDSIFDDLGIDCFLNVGCIGDSLASGESVSSDGTRKDFYQYSWGQFLSRITGNKYYNWSKGGFTTRDWLDSEYATECYDGDHKCECYIIGLGQNDCNRSVPIGSLSDITGDPDSNPQTYYGNYGAIISKILSIQNRAKIFVLTDPNQNVETSGYNEAIRQIASRFDNNVFLIDLYANAGSKYNPIFKDPNLFKRGHGNAISYRIMASILMDEINKYMRSHPSNFSDIQFIGTDLEW